MNAAPARPLRLLVLAAREPWPLNGGGRLRLFHWLRALVRRAAVSLVVCEPAQYASRLPQPLRVIAPRARPGSPREGEGWALERGTARLAGNLAVRHFGANAAVVDWLKRHARPAEFEAVLVYGAALGVYADALRVPFVWDAVDELVLTTLRAAAPRGPRSWLTTARRAVLYAAYERHVARRAHATVFASPVDAAWGRRWAGGARGAAGGPRIVALTNGVDFEFFAGARRAPQRGTVAFIGTLDFPPNVHAVTWFVRHVWPGVHAADPTRRLLIAGRAPAPAVRALAREPGVELHPDVPDVRPYFERAAVIVVPTFHGAGVKNKVLEACAMGRPVVASPRALAGLSARRGADLLCAASPAAWTCKLERLLRNPDHAAAIGRCGQSWVRRAHRWPALGGELLGLIAAAAPECGTQKAECRLQNAEFEIRDAEWEIQNSEFHILSSAVPVREAAACR